ncbi:MAG TPA: MBL fold metallo-hydrolase [Vicinamibacterales bacterium]|nr:MBL fold metallo-hydrolase [Vicinamibacterales bacterium]
MKRHGQGSHSRREFIRELSLGGAVLLATPGCARIASRIWPQPAFHVHRISTHLTVIGGAVNGALLDRDGAILSIGGDPRPNPAAAERVLFTHHRRDMIWAGRELANRGALVVVPEKERNSFTDVRSFWTSFAEDRFHDYSQRTTKVSVEPWDVAETVAGGTVHEWRGQRIHVLETPGYTRGAVTYITEVDGNKVAFTGDLIYGDGRILDLYSLQDSIPDVRAPGYLGFMSRAAPLIHSLQRVAQEKPDILVPTRGPLIQDPQNAIDRLIRRLRAVYRNYLSISGLRWSVPERMQTLATRMLGDGAQVSYASTAETIGALPSWLRAIEASRLLVSESGAAFLIDCGGPDDRVIRAITTLQREGTVSSVDGIYLTHYHDDHTAQAEAGARAFGCPVYACKEITDILTNPRAYRMPAQHSEPIRNVVPLDEGQSMEWKEFRFTSFYFPGQTLYHGALAVVRRPGERLWFIGDSFTPTGLGDECPQNRQFMRQGEGFMRCLDLLAAEPGQLLINQHVSPSFRFSTDQIARFRELYRERLKLLQELFPWGDPNFGLDEGWARCFPYEIRVRSGERATLAVRILNHFGSSQVFRIRPHPPAGWRIVRYDPRLRLDARATGDLGIDMEPSAGVASGPHILTVDVSMGAFEFPRWAEAMLLMETSLAPEKTASDRSRPAARS